MSQAQKSLAIVAAFWLIQGVAMYLKAPAHIQNYMQVRHERTN